MRVLIVEDYRPLREGLERGLRAVGFAVDSAADGEAGLARAESGEYDVVVLDLMLPRLDGLSVLRAMRGRKIDSAVLVLTARDGIVDRVKGLDLGADDYLVKPFAFEELLARVRALRRRRYSKRNPIIEVGDLRVDTVARVAHRGAALLDLTAREYALLEFLALRSGELVTRTSIWEHLYELHADARSNVVDVYVGYLRRKLEAGGGSRLIHTRRGQGYVLAEDPPCE
jgi:DNA-binding response OmpR family regulator